MALDLKERLAERLRTWSQTPVATGRHSAQILAVASNKGGVGKTTTAVNLAVAFAAMDFEVLLIDLDPQAHVAAALRLAPPVDAPSLGDVLLGRRQEVCEAAYATAWPRLHVAGSDKGLGELEMVLSAKIGKELLLAGAMRATRTHYDLIIIDCPPHMGTLTLNALCAADHLLVPADMSILALEGVADILGTVETLRARLQRSIALCGVVATRFDQRLSQANEMLMTQAAETWGDKLLGTRIPQTASVNRAHMAGQSIFEYAPRSPGATAYRALAEEIKPLLGLTAFDTAPHLAAHAVGAEQGVQRRNRD